MSPKCHGRKKEQRSGVIRRPTQEVGWKRRTCPEKAEEGDSDGKITHPCRGHASGVMNTNTVGPKGGRGFGGLMEVDEARED